MNRLMAVLIFLVSVNVYANDIQWSQGFTADCDNDLARDDGTPMPVSEIYMVKYLVMNKGADPIVDTPAFSVEMMGGCKPVPVDTKSVLTPGEYEIYGVTVDNSEPNRLSSIPSDPVSLRITKNRPKPPKNLRY